MTSQIFHFHTAYSDHMTLFCRTDVPGKLSLGKEGAVVAEIHVSPTSGWHYFFDVEKDTNYCLICTNVELRLGYLATTDPVIYEKGVLFLANGTAVDSFADSYDQPCRNQYHFAPFANWMNDPNGLCWYQGRFHMFYQFNPYDTCWGNAYWGHAVSKDLIHWVHLPVALFPQEELKDKVGYKGGAYSGSAYAGPNGIHLYYTRCYSPMVRNEETKEIQVHALCDGISVTKEEVVIHENPVQARDDHNFRDPMITIVDGIPTIFIGANVSCVCSVLAFQQESSAWTCKGVVFQDPLASCLAFECVNVMFGEKRSCAILCSLQDSKGTPGKTRKSVVYVGTHEGLSFHVGPASLLDFGTGSYALQLVQKDQKSATAFAWCLDTYGNYKTGTSLSNGAMSLPRICTIQDGKWNMQANPAVSALFDINLLDSKDVSPQGTIAIPNGTFLWELQFLPNGGPWKLEFCATESSFMGLQYQNGKIQFLYEEDGNSKIPTDLVLESKSFTSLSIFVDRSLVEVFVNEGEGYGSCSYFIPKGEWHAKWEFANNQLVLRNKITKLKGIWETGGKNE